MECLPVEIQTNDSCARCGIQHVAERERQHYGGLSYRMLRRGRGLLLRFVRRRLLAAATGLALVVPAAWIEWGGAGEASWWMSGVALVLGATGVALLWTGIAGLPPDYIDADE